MSIYIYDAVVDSKVSIDCHRALLSPINNLIYLEIMNSADPVKISLWSPRKAGILRM